MKLNSFLMLATIVAAVFGLAFLVASFAAGCALRRKADARHRSDRPYRRLGDPRLRHRVLGRPQWQRGGNVEGRDAGGPDRQRSRRSDPAARDRHRPSQRPRLASGPDQRRTGDRVRVFSFSASGERSRYGSLFNSMVSVAAIEASSMSAISFAGRFARTIDQDRHSIVPGDAGIDIVTDHDGPGETQSRRRNRALAMDEFDPRSRGHSDRG